MWVLDQNLALTEEQCELLTAESSWEGDCTQRAGRAVGLGVVS